MKSNFLWCCAPFVVACSSSHPDVTVPPPVTPSVATSVSAEPAVSPVPTASAAISVAPTPATPKPDMVWKGMKTPESVLYDAEQDRYLVSNIHGKPLDADNNGFISELSPDGTVKNLNFVAGSDKVKLNAPKGMALSKGVLYVSDIDRVRMFDAKSGAPRGEVVIAGSSFLNDVAAGPDGKVYVSDSGLAQGKSDFEPTGTDAVYVIEKGKAKPLAKAKELNRPNGLLVDDKGVMVCTFGAAEVFRLGPKGEKTEVTATPNPGLDGLAQVEGGILVSSWKGEAIYKGTLGGKFEPILEGIGAPADIAYDKKRSRVVVPRFMADTVEAYTVK